MMSTTSSSMPGTTPTSSRVRTTAEQNTQTQTSDLSVASTSVTGDEIMAMEATTNNERTTNIEDTTAPITTEDTVSTETTQVIYTERKQTDDATSPQIEVSETVLSTRGNHPIVTRVTGVVTTDTWIDHTRGSTNENTTGWRVQSDSTTLIHPWGQGQIDCSRQIVIAAGAGAAAVVIVMVVCLLLLIKMRLKWQQKLKDERLKTDIWTMSTLNNTIFNENFMDYNLAPAETTRKPPSTRPRTSKTKLLSSISQTASDRSSSSTYDGQFAFQDVALRRNTSSPDLYAHHKVNAMRQLSTKSNFSQDIWVNQPSEGRSRTSTFTGGRRDKVDRHVLVDHDEFQAFNQTHSQIVTEL